MRLFRIALTLLAVSSLLSSCGAPIVQNTLSLPGRALRGAAHATGMGGVAGL